MNLKWVLPFAIGIPSLALAVYALSRPKEYVLIVAHTGPGHLDIIDGPHVYQTATQVTVTATPDDPVNYEPLWNVNGTDVEQGAPTYPIYVNSVVSLGVSFVPKNGGSTTPTGISPLGTITTVQNFRFWYGNPFAPVDIAECKEDWTDGQSSPQLLVFKVHDAANRGVPNIPVQVYPEPNPDGTVYKSLCLFNGIAYNVNSPLELTTDTNGLVTIPVRNLYQADDITKDGGGKELSKGTNLWAKACTPPPQSCDVHMPVYHGDSAGLFEWWQDNGGGGVISYNRIIRAQIKNTDKGTSQIIGVNFGVRWQA